MMMANSFPEAAAPVTPANAPRTLEAGDLNFLIVEDDPFIRLVTKKILRSFTSGSIAEASNGVGALEMLRDRRAAPPDVILCDLNMPEMDGMEFLRHLAAESHGLPVILISSHDDTLGAAVKKMAQAYGLTLLGYLQKPVSREQLETLLRRHEPAPAVTAGRAAEAPGFSLEEILHGVAEREFEPFYQPKVDFRTGVITGAEALARWLHPARGLVSPYAFIEILEKSGNTRGLTFLMLEKAAAACALLHARGFAISVSVNLSSDLLVDPGLAENITQEVKKTGLDPRHVMLEVTESTAMTHVAPSLENLARLRMHGFGLSIDDFGTGFSNLQQLTNIAFSELKIDQSFVKGCTDNKELCAVVRSCIEMAHHLKIKCIAEGVETRQDWDTLKSMGCDMAQGYFIARPMNLPSFLEFCALHSPAAPVPF